MNDQIKSVAITGATSMIGIALIKVCLQKNIHVLAIIRRQSTRIGRLPKSPLIKLYECNLDKLDEINDTDDTYDVFYHFAWEHTSKSNRDNPVLQEMNIKYTLDAVGLAHRLGCRTFVGAGSQAEYGYVNGVIRSDTAVHPTMAYGMAKYAAGKLSEKMCTQLGITHIWGRIFSVYGQYDNEGTMLIYAIDQFIKGESAKFSAATQTWNYLNEKDAGEIFFRLGTCVNENRVYCIGNRDSRPLKSFILEMKECFGEGAECEFACAEDESILQGINPDISALEKDIQYTPQVRFADGIMAVIEYRKSIKQLVSGGGQNDLAIKVAIICCLAIWLCSYMRRDDRL